MHASQPHLLRKAQHAKLMSLYNSKQQKILLGKEIPPLSPYYGLGVFIHCLINLHPACEVCSISLIKLNRTISAVLRICHGTTFKQPFQPVSLHLSVLQPSCLQKNILLAMDAAMSGAFFCCCSISLVLSFTSVSSVGALFIAVLCFSFAV